MTERFRPAGRSQVAPFHVMRVFEAANRRLATGAPTFNLSAGQPGTPAPRAVLNAARRALDEQLLGYTASRGLVELRAAIAGHYRRTYGLEVGVDDIIVTTGSSGAFVLAFLAAFDAGDRVVIARPGYPAYRNTLQALGCEVVELDCGPRTGFRLSVAQLAELDPRPAGVVVASPANPTGTMVGAQDLAEIARWCAAHGVRLISDEIYHGISYGRPVATAWQAAADGPADLPGGSNATAARHAVVIGSFSKYFSMTGWRIGWMLVPQDLDDAVDALAGNLAICPPTLSQHAAVRAFESYEELDGHVDRYRANRDLLTSRLPEIGLTEFAPPDGAFYIYADVSRWTGNSMSWVFRLLEETGVALAPGVDFDPIDGGRHVRISFAGPQRVLDEALAGLGTWLARQPTR